MTHDATGKGPIPLNVGDYVEVEVNGYTIRLAYHGDALGSHVVLEGMDCDLEQDGDYHYPVPIS